MKKAVLWDFGGVILSSPFEAFNRYEVEHGLPPDFVRSVNATNPHDNAWAKLERGEIEPTEFDRQFADESATLGHRVPGADVLALLHGAIRPEMVAMLDRVKAAGYKGERVVMQPLGVACAALSVRESSELVVGRGHDHQHGGGHAVKLGGIGAGGRNRHGGLSYYSPNGLHLLGQPAYIICRKG